MDKLRRKLDTYVIVVIDLKAFVSPHVQRSFVFFTMFIS